MHLLVRMNVMLDFICKGIAQQWETQPSKNSKWKQEDIRPKLQGRKDRYDTSI